jgi:DNA-binding phage protein
LGQIDSIYTAPSIENVSEPLPDGEYQLFANGALVATVRRVKGEGWLDRHTLKTGARRTTHPRLHRMLSEKGNPSMDNLDAILRAVREQPRVNLEAHAVKAA